MSTITTLLRIKADAKQAVSGLKPLQTSLEETAKDAQTTEKALNNLDGQHKISINDQAVENARNEIRRLRNQMREQLALDVNADTREAQRRIKQLQQSVKALDTEHAVVEADIVVNQTGIMNLQRVLADVQSSGANIIPIPGSLSSLTNAARGATTALGGAGGAATTAGAAAAAAVGGIALFDAAFVVLATDAGFAAADVETLQVQLDALTGGRGKETLKFLQAWAASTPFELDQATEATKRLVGAGVELEDLPDTLNDIGNISAAFDSSRLADFASIFAQMESSGKASYENIQQLADNGIPAWQMLADQMGITVAEAQKLATQGKFGIDVVHELRNALGDKFGTAMADSADTLNGKISSLKDTFHQTYVEFGQNFLPVLKGGVDVLQDVADITSDFVRIWSWAYQKIMDLPFFQVIADGLKNVDASLDHTADGVDWLADRITGSDDAATGFATTMKEDAAEAAADVTAELEEWKRAVQEAEDAVKATVEAFASIGANVRTKISFIISKDDLEEDIQKTIEGVKAVPAVLGKDGKVLQAAVEGIPPVDLPANLKVGDIKGLDDNEQELIGKIDSWVAEGLEEGARRAEIIPGFDEDAWYRKVRKGARELVIDAGVDPKNAEKVLTTLFGLPRKVPAGADISGAKDDLAALTTPITVPIFTEIRDPSGKPVTPAMESALTPAVPPTAPAITPSIQPPTVAEGATSIPDLIAPKSVPITPTVGETQDVKDTLNNVANPGGKPRVAHIKPVVDAWSLLIAQGALAALTKTQTKTIKVHLEENPTGDSLDTPGAVNRLLGASRALTVTAASGAAAAGGGGQRPVQRLAPRQTPVAVYLDGAEIADRLDARRSMAAVQSIRRTA
jgi:tape measure domain-containing protein